MNYYFLTSLVQILFKTILISSVLFCILKFVSLIFLRDQPRFWFAVWNIFLIGMFLLFLNQFIYLVNYTNPFKWEKIDLSTVSKPNFLALRHLPYQQDKLISFTKTAAPVLTILYCIGMLYKIVVLIGSIVKVKNINKENTLQPCKQLEVKIKQLCKEVGISKPVKLIISNTSKLVFTVNFLKPLIILPLALTNNLTSEQVESILLHELAHIKRNDYLINFIHKIIETVLVFNPIVFLIALEIDKNREFCCDDFVVSFIKSKKDYSLALYQSLLSQNDVESIVMASSGFYKFQLLDRIKRINGRKKIYSSSQKSLLLFSIVVLISVIFLWSAPIIVKAAIHHKLIIITNHQIKEYDLLRKVQAHSIDTRSLPQDSVYLTDKTKAQHSNFMEEDTSWETKKSKIKAYTQELQLLISSSNTSPEAILLENKLSKIRSFYKSGPWIKVESELQSKADSLHELIKQQRNYDKIEELGSAISELTKQETLLKKTFGLAELSDQVQQYYNSPEYLQKQKKIHQLGQEIQRFYESDEWKRHEGNKLF